MTAKQGITDRGLNGLKKRDQIRNPLSNLDFITARLIVEATTPDWHIARTVSLNFLTAIYVARNLILR
jgi:hypothetical protein